MEKLNNLLITKVEDGFYRFAIDKNLNGLKEVLYNLSSNPFKNLESYISNFQEILNDTVEIAVSEEGYIFVYAGLFCVLSITENGNKKTFKFSGNDKKYVEKKLVAHMCDRKFYERMISVFDIISK